MQEQIREILGIFYVRKSVTTEQAAQEILNLVKKELIEKLPEKKKKYCILEPWEDCTECLKGQSYNQCLEDIIKVINEI